MSQTRVCEHCGSSFTVRFPSVVKRFCVKACQIAGRATCDRSGVNNPNWRGGKTEHELYWVWQDMIRRCTVPEHSHWDNYGGRGIQVCDRWRHDFWAYVSDLGERPNTDVRWTVDRIDNDGHYEPGNVRWATYATQASNRRSCGWENRERNDLGQFAGRKSA